MPKKSIYLKYREERDYAKYLKEFKKSHCQIQKVPRVQLVRVDLNALMKNKKPSVPVSLPIKHFHKIRSTMSNNDSGQKELPTPKDKIGWQVPQDFRPMGPPTAPAANLRMVRHHVVVAAPHDTTAGTTRIKSVPIKPNLLPVNITVPATKDAERKCKKVETYTPSNAINTDAKAPFKRQLAPLQRNEHNIPKRKPIENNYGIDDILNSANSKEVGTNIPTDIIYTAAKANVMPFQGDHININYTKKNDTAEKANAMPHELALRKISFTSFNEVGTNTSTDIIDTGVIPNNHISIKHKLPVPVAPTKKNNGISHKDGRVNSKDVGTSTSTDIMQVNSANEVKRCLKDLVIKSTQTDKILIANEKELQILGIVTESGVTNDELIDALESFKKVKELSKYNVNEVIDLDGPADDNAAKLLELARFHSEKNKKAMYENNDRASTSTKSAPTSIDLEQQKISEMRCKLFNSMNYQQQNCLDSDRLSYNKESNKESKTTESGVNYDETNMDIEIDVLETQNIVNQPAIATPSPQPSLNNSTTQQRPMQPITSTPQKQNKESSMPQLHAPSLQQIIHENALLQYLQHQKMRQQQYEQDLKQRNMQRHATANQKQLQKNLTQQLKNSQAQQLRSKSPHIRELYSKSPQFQQQHSKSPQFQQQHSKSPQFQQLHSKSPQIREAYSTIPQTQQPLSNNTIEQPPQSQSTESQEQLQHPLDRRIRIRDQQRTALPQQHYQYKAERNGYQDPVFSQVPQQTNPTQQSQFQLYPGDPRIQTFQSQIPHLMPSAPHTMSSYNANPRTSSSTCRNNCCINQQYW